MNKLAIIVPGQGMACSYAAGALIALAKEHNLTAPDIAIASSGSAGIMSYYIAGQYDLMFDLPNFLSTKRFINFLRIRKIIDVDYLIDDVFKKFVPLDVKKIKQSKTDYFISATNFNTGDIEYLSHKNGEDIFETMRATKAVPIAFGKRVDINGNLYYDSILSSLKNLHILKAIELGATHIILIDSNKHDRVGMLIFNLWKFFRSKEFKRNYNLSKKKSQTGSVGSIDIMTITPKIKLRINTLNNSKKLLVETINLGYNECKNNKKISEFIKDFNNGH